MNRYYRIKVESGSVMVFSGRRIRWLPSRKGKNCFAVSLVFGIHLRPSPHEVFGFLPGLLESASVLICGNGLSSIHGDQRPENIFRDVLAKGSHASIRKTAKQSGMRRLGDGWIAIRLGGPDLKCFPGHTRHRWRRGKGNLLRTHQRRLRNKRAQR